MYFLMEVLPFTAMLMVECINVGQSTLYKAAVSKGLSYHVFMVYSYAISSLILLCLSYLFRRKTVLPSFTASLLARFFVLALLGFMAQFVGYKGMAYSSPILGSALSNLTPATTFVLVILLRMEKLVLRNLSSQAKIVGTMVSMTGAFVVIFYSGPVLIAMHTNQKTLIVATSPESNRIVGGILLAACYLIFSIWCIYQTKVVKDYPAELVIVFFYSLFCGIISAVVGLVMEPNSSAWKVKPNVELISILYSGIMEMTLGVVVVTWGLHVKGPVYVTLFKPLSIVIAAFMDVIFLGENLYLGSIIGSVIISVGFYIVTWGKTKEEVREKLEGYTAESSANANAPLLIPYIVSTKQEDEPA